MRLAWFSPVPPVRSGIATCSAELLPPLRARHHVDVFVDEPVAALATDTRSAHDFLPLHRREPYDLTVYQLGNSSHHDYAWPYLFRFPGLTILHDVHLHHARAAALLRTRRTADYRAEFAANHPDASADAAELAVAGFDSHLYYAWPMIRLAIAASKVAGVHSRLLVQSLRDDPGVGVVEHVRLSQGTLVGEERARHARARVRGKHGIDAEAVTFGCFGGLSPEKRLPQILDAFAALLVYAPGARLLLGGAGVPQYDLRAAVSAHGLAAHTIITGYVETDEELTDHIAAVDVTLNLRWPTARETSGPWLRALAAGRPSIVLDLIHTADVPALDPRTWTRSGGEADAEPIAVAVDVLDEDHSLRLAMRRLATDATLRGTLGEAAARYWQREHAPAAMLADYERLIDVARAAPEPAPALPAHLRDDGMRLLDRLLPPFGPAAERLAPFRRPRGTAAKEVNF
jgi:glycosyltransferase involved in cell wall biosynthesis